MSQTCTSRQELFSRVVTVGPDHLAHGGIASVIASYRRCFPHMSFVETNSRHGFLPGMVKLAYAMIKLPFLRLAGKDIMHVHSAAGKSFVRKSILIGWGRMLGFRIIFHNHSGLIKDYADKVGTDQIKKVLQKCSHTVVLSDVWKNYFEHTMEQSHVSVLNNIVEKPKHGHSEKHDNVVRFLFMGLLVERKGIFDLIEAVRLLSPAYKGRFEVIVGGGHGEEARFLNEISQPDIAGCIHYAGWIGGQTKDEWLDKCDISILPSYAEGTPISILEGFVRGMPAIATKVGGIPDLMTDGTEGILIEPGDIKALAEAMKFYIENPEKIATSGDAAIKAVIPFLPETVGSQLENIYRSII